MTVLDLFKGKKMMVETDMKTFAEMTIDHVEEKVNRREIEEGTAANDWWPKEQTWTTFVIHFTNGSHKEFSSLKQITIHE